MSELNLHYAVADLLTRFALPGVVWWHTYNNSMSVRHGAKMKRLGVKAGVPDLTIIIPDPEGSDILGITICRVVFVELKSTKGRLSDSQIAFRDAVQALGCLYYTAYDVDDAALLLVGIGAIKSVTTSPARLSVLRRATVA